MTAKCFSPEFGFPPTAQYPGPRLAAIIVDLSEDLRSREELSLDHLLKNTRILMSTVAHEIRNLSSAVLVVHKNLVTNEGARNERRFSGLWGA